jgi:hypothetical protein
MLRINLAFGIGAALLLSFAGGCGKPAPASKAVPAKTSAPALVKAEPETVLQFHWIGANKILADTNAGGVLTIGKLPQTRNLEMQTLERLALTFAGTASNWTSTPFDMPKSGDLSPPTNPPPLLPILSDLVRNECYCLARQFPDNSTEVALAVNLSAERSQLWQSNLNLAFGESTNGARWHLTNWTAKSGASSAPRLLELSRAGDYAILGLAAKTNTLAAEVAANILGGRPPFLLSASNDWLYLSLNPIRVSEGLGLGFTVPDGAPTATVTAAGAPDGVRTRVQLDFPEPLPATLEDWKIPTNVVHDPLISFTAIRSLSPTLSSLGIWKRLDVGPAPDQAYFWSQSGWPFISYGALVASNANVLFNGLSNRLFDANSWFKTNGLGSFAKATNFDGVIWSNLTLMTPYMRMATNGAGPFVYAGMEADLHTNRSMPPQLIEALLNKTNLVAYDWEFTGPRLEQWLYFGQFFRWALYLGQIPPKSASFAWLTSMTPLLGNSATFVTKTGPKQLVVGRKSEIGFTSVELDLIADWLESPHFPRGLHTFLGKPEMLPLKTGTHHSRPTTNSVPATSAH